MLLVFFFLFQKYFLFFLSSLLRGLISYDYVVIAIWSHRCKMKVLLVKSWVPNETLATINKTLAIWPLDSIFRGHQILGHSLLGQMHTKDQNGVLFNPITLNVRREWIPRPSYISWCCWWHKKRANKFQNNEYQVFTAYKMSVHKNWMYF